MKLLTKLFILSLLIACPVFALADNTFPSFPMAFWGAATLDGQQLPSGTKIEAFCNSSLIGSVTMAENGIYGYIDSDKNKLLVSGCTGNILFEYLPSGATTPLAGVNQIEYTNGFQAGTTVNENLNFLTGNSTVTVNANQISSLLTPSVLALPTGASASSTPSLQVEQNITINDSVSTTGTSTVILPTNTTITTVGGQNFDATALTATNPASGTLSGLTTGAVVGGSLQWGIVNLGLQFSNPIIISIYVGDSFDGQTLSVVRSTSATSGWTSDGIVSPATCVVSAGLCTFSATKASYYVAYQTANTSGGTTGSTGGNTGGGGSASVAPTSNSNPAWDSVNVGISDLSIMAAEWGETGTGLSADLNHDGVVDILDFSILAADWNGQ